MKAIATVLNLPCKEKKYYHKFASEHRRRLGLLTC